MEKKSKLTYEDSLAEIMLMYLCLRYPQAAKS